MMNQNIKSNSKLRTLVLSLMLLFVAGLSFVGLQACDMNVGDEETRSQQIEGIEGEVYDEVDVMPEFPGGIQAVRKYIAANLIYPEIAAKNGVAAKIYVKFIVNPEGKVTGVQLMETRANTTSIGKVVVVGYEKTNVADMNVEDGIKALQEEAIRVIGTIPDFKPGERNGKKVNVQYTFPIVFELSKKDS